MAKELGNTVRRYPHKLARHAKISIQKVLSLTLTKESGPEEDIGACTDDPEHSGAAQAIITSPVHVACHSVDPRNHGRPSGELCNSQACSTHA